MSSSGGTSTTDISSSSYFEDSSNYLGSQSKSGSNEKSETVQLKRVISMWDGVGIIVNAVIGSGIFITPKSVLGFVGSPGMALVVWAVTGLVCMIGALCYAELAIMMPESGADYTYIREAFGSLAAFLFVWVNVLFQDAAGRSAGAMTFATYLIELFWTCGDSTDGKAYSIQLVAVIAYLFLTALNCYQIRNVVRVIDFFSVTKSIALFIIIITGFIWLGGEGGTDNLTGMFHNTSDSPGNYALAFYSAYWAYTGYSTLSQVVEEVKEPLTRNITMSIAIGMAFVTTLYILANLAYIIVLTPYEMVTTSAVAVTYGAKITFVLFYIMPIFVTLSSFGTVNSNIMSSSRLLLVAARSNHLPRMFSLIGREHVAPIPALLFSCFISILLIVTNSIDSLILYTTYASVIGSALAICAQIYLRLTRNDLHLPLHLPLFIPIGFLAFFLLVLVLPFTLPDKRLGIGMSFIIILSGVPFYYLFVWWKNKPAIFFKIDHLAMVFCQKIFDCLPETVEMKDILKTK